MQFDLDSLMNLLVAYSLKIVAALVIFLIGKWIAKRLSVFIENLMIKNGVERTLTSFLKNIIYYVLFAAVILAAAGQLGIKTTSFMAILGAASLAVGLALKDSLANFSSGVMLIIFRPFSIGDVVTVAGETGKVESITIFNTVMNTGDNQRKIIPNGAISNATITNITANPTRRVDLVVGISYDDDIRQAKALLEEIVSRDPRVFKDPAPTIVVQELADSSVNFAVRPWVKTDDYWDVKFALLEDIKITFDEKGICIPYPQQDLHIHKVEAFEQK